jgi:hydroxypyruvate isomerase
MRELGVGGGAIGTGVLFTVLRQANYDRYTLCEAQASKEPERFLRWYKALWTELCRTCS